MSSFVTDADNMVASVRNFNLGRALCFAHTLNLVVKKSLDVTPKLRQLRWVKSYVTPNIAEATNGLMEEWGTRGKAANMIACANLLNVLFCSFS